MPVIELLNKQNAPMLTRLNKPTYSPAASVLLSERKVDYEVWRSSYIYI